MIDQLDPLQQGVYFTFIIALFGMIAGSVYFFAQKSELSGKYRSASVLSGVICLIAAMTYYYMRSIYLEGAENGESKFPTEFRYIDWIITVPLMLIKFPTLLGMGRKGQAFMRKLVIASIIMLVTAFIGEINFTDKAMHFGFYAVSVFFWLYIIYHLLFALRNLPKNTSEATAVAVRRMFFFILIGWIIYPIGYLMPSFGLEADYRELLYNIGDIINKVGLGLVVVAGGFTDKRESAASPAMA